MEIHGHPHPEVTQHIEEVVDMSVYAMICCNSLQFSFSFSFNQVSSINFRVVDFYLVSLPIFMEIRLQIPNKSCL